MVKILPKIIKYTAVGAFVGTVGFCPIKTFAQRELKSDLVEIRNKIPPEGTSDSIVLKNSPNPRFMCTGENKLAKFVVNLSNNVLYQYDADGKPVSAYLVASGKPSTPTYEGYSVVSHVETFPYSRAPKFTKRRKNPRSYGPNIIILDKLNPITGERSMTGQFIHGNNDSTSLGQKVSMGCIRMNNKVIKYLSSIVKRGDYVIIKK